MLTPEESNVTLKFLDRVSITGHGERQAMNAIVQKIYVMSQDVPAPGPLEEPADNSCGNSDSLDVMGTTA